MTTPSVMRMPRCRVTGPITASASTPVTTMVVMGTTSNCTAFGTRARSHFSMTLMT
ncbi:hypothetical protein D3C76_1802390 [compost metagenome]